MEQKERGDLRTVIGKRLGEARKAAGISQEKLAEAIGRGRTTVYRWEAGGAGMGLEDLERCAGVIGCSVDRVLTGVEASGRLVEIYDKLSEKRKAALLEFGEWMVGRPQ